MGNNRHLTAHFNVVEFLHDLANRREEVTLVGEQLRHRAPKGADSKQTVETLRQHKAEVIAWLRERESSQEGYPLSQGQLGLWLDWQRDPDNAMYNLVTVARLHEEVQIDILHQAAQRLVDRHPSLRTVYRFVDEQPQQYVQAQQAVDFTLVDGTIWTEAEIQAWIESEADRPFDLAAGPLMRIRVLQITSQALSTGEYPAVQSTHGASAAQAIFHWTIHHITADLLTIEILQEELRSCYRALLAGAEPALATPSLTYRDFLRWEQDVLTGNQAQLATFWQNQLGNIPLLLNLPSQPLAAQEGKPKLACQSLDFTLDPHLTQQLRQLAQRHGTTLYTLLLTAYQVLLGRYTGQGSFLNSSPTAVRSLPGLTHLVGYLVNPVLVRADLQHETDSPLTFATLLGRTQQTTAAVMAHHLYPYHAMLRHWHPQLTTEQFFSGLASFVFDTIRQPATDSDLFAEVLMDGQRGLAEPLTLFIFDHQTTAQAQLMGRIVYHASNFDHAFIERMVGHFETLLTGIIANPDQPVQHLPLLTTAEYRQIVHDWNNTAVDFGPPQTIHALFEQQVARTPDAVAVVMSEEQGLDPEHSLVSSLQSLTYAELNARANQLAHHLITLGVKADTLVAVAMERSLEMVVALLAVLKAGGAYVPIDPTYPPERIRFMLADSAAPILLTQSHLFLAQETAQTIQHLILVDTLDGQLAGQSTGNPHTATIPADLAYVIYTSGSTGQPKGVIALHRGLMNRFQWMWRQLPFLPDEVACQKTSLAFVDSVWEIFGPLVRGVPLVVIPDSIVKDPQALIAHLAAHQISRIVLVPSLLKAILESEPDLMKRLPRLTTWICSGEALPTQLAQMFYTALPQARLLNLYGSSEVAGDVTWFETPTDYHTQWCTSVIPIGRPIDNTQLYLLDAHLQLVPAGVPGQLYVGGDNLARGYLNRHDLTAERFIDHSEFGRLYKTGDLCRWLPAPKGHPNIEYIGRTDFQVKLRGFRIELSEIESALLAQAGVREAVVLVREDVPGDKRLVAYLVGAAELANLRQTLAQRLPDYMIPAAFVWLDALPLTPNGKLDRKALPTPNVERTADLISRPRTLLEQQMVALWEQTLGVHPLGIHDNFFAIGGHSLLAVQLLARLQPLFHQPIPLRHLFANPTVAQLAAAAQHAGSEPDQDTIGATLVALQPQGAQPPLYCLPGAGGGILYLYALAQALGETQPFYALESVGFDGKAEPFATVEAAAAHQVQALRQRQPNGPYQLAGHSFGGLVAYAMAQQLLQAGETVSTLLMLDSGAPTGKATPLDEVAIILLYERLFLEEFGKAPTLTQEQLAPLASAERQRLFKQALESAGYLPPDSPIEQIRGIINVVAADLRATDYLPKRFVPLPIQLFVAMDDERSAEATQALIDGWRTYGAVTVHEIPGTHSTLMYAPHVQTLAQAMATVLQTTEKALP